MVKTLHTSNIFPTPTECLKQDAENTFMPAPPVGGLVRAVSVQTVNFRGRDDALYDAPSVQQRSQTVLRSYLGAHQIDGEPQNMPNQLPGRLAELFPVEHGNLRPLQMIFVDLAYHKNQITETHHVITSTPVQMAAEYKKAINTYALVTNSPHFQQTSPAHAQVAYNDNVRATINQLLGAEANNR